MTDIHIPSTAVRPDPITDLIATYQVALARIEAAHHEAQQRAFAQLQSALVHELAQGRPLPDGAVVTSMQAEGKIWPGEMVYSDDPVFAHRIPNQRQEHTHGSK